MILNKSDLSCRFGLFLLSKKFKLQCDFAKM